MRRVARGWPVLPRSEGRGSQAGWRRCRNQLENSVPRLAPMPHRQHHNLFSVVMIESDVSSVSELNHQLTELWRQLFNRKATLRMLRKRLHAPTNCLHRALGLIATFGNLEGMKRCHLQHIG